MVAELLRKVSHQENLVNPELQRESWQFLYDTFVNPHTGLGIVVPQCDRTPDEIRALQAENRMLAYVDKNVSSGTDVRLLLQALPGISHLAKTGLAFENFRAQHGWLDVEASPQTPYRGKSPSELKRMFEEQGLAAQTVNTYLLVVAFGRHFWNQDFDSEIGGVYILGSKGMSAGDKRMGLFAASSSDGQISLRPYARRHQDPNPYFGGRSAGLKEQVATFKEELDPDSIGSGTSVFDAHSNQTAHATRKPNSRREGPWILVPSIPWEVRQHQVETSEALPSFTDEQHELIDGFINEKRAKFTTADALRLTGNSASLHQRLTVRAFLKKEGLDANNLPEDAFRRLIDKIGFADS